MSVEPHKHCPICGTPIPLNELVCSPDCQKVWDARLKQRKRSQLILYVVKSCFTVICSILFVTHSIDEALILGDKIVVLEKGIIKSQYEIKEDKYGEFFEYGHFFEKIYFNDFE